MNSGYSPTPTIPVRREVMRMRWNDLTFLHWPYSSDEVQALLPDGLTADAWVDADGNSQTWVGLVPFRMTVGLPGGRVIPRVGIFPETNVRTYVRGPDQTPGVWFCSLEAGGLAASATARLTYGLPYFWADMSIDAGLPDSAHLDTGPEWAYASTRRWPGPRGAHHHSKVRVGEPIEPGSVSDFEHYLTARWGLYSRFPSASAGRGRNLYAAVDHPRWPLRKAELLDLDDGLMVAAGLTPPTTDPIVHWTEGVEVRIGRPVLAV